MSLIPKLKLKKYLKRNPEIKTIVVAGAYGRKSAIRAIALFLNEVCNVSIGVNENVDADVVIMDYKSEHDFPDIDPDIVVITSCRNAQQAERFFGVANRAGVVFVNFNDVPQHFSTYLKNPQVLTYGDELPADFYFENRDMTLEGITGDFVDPVGDHLPVRLKLLGEHNVRPATLAFAIGKNIGMNRTELLHASQALRPLHGRMSPARGLRGSIIIDDSSYIALQSVHLGIETIEALQSSAKMIVTDSLQKVANDDMQLLTDIVILGEQPAGERANPKVHYFKERGAMIEYICSRLEPEGLVLLEIPVPEIIEKYIW